MCSKKTVYTNLLFQATANKEKLIFNTNISEWVVETLRGGHWGTCSYSPLWIPKLLMYSKKRTLQEIQNSVTLDAHYPGHVWFQQGIHHMFLKIDNIMVLISLEENDMNANCSVFWKLMGSTKWVYVSTGIQFY